MKILFADYDGCLNRFSDSYQTPVRNIQGYFTQAEPELVYRLNLIVDRTDSGLVLSSSWRHIPDWRQVMRASGITKRFYDRTSVKNANEHCRGVTIKAWLKEHPEVTRYAILDDDSDAGYEHPPECFFKTNVEEGLTEEIAKDITDFLNGKI